MRYLVVCFIIFFTFLIGGCAPRWLLVNSNGIASYNRHTGQFEILWENHSAVTIEKHDTIYVDSVRHN